MDIIEFVRSYDPQEADRYHIRIGRSGRSKDPALCGVLPRYRPEHGVRDAWDHIAHPYAESVCPACAARFAAALNPDA